MTGRQCILHLGKKEREACNTSKVEKEVRVLPRDANRSSILPASKSQARMSYVGAISKKERG